MMVYLVLSFKVNKKRARLAKLAEKFEKKKAGCLTIPKSAFNYAAIVVSTKKIQFFNI